MKSKTKISSSLVLLGVVLLGQKNSLDVGQHASLGDGDTSQKLVQFFVIPDGQLKMARIDPLLLVVTGSVTSQLEDLGSEVLHHGCEVHWSTSTDSLGIVAPAEETVNTTDWELKPSTAGTGLGLGTGLASLSTSRHALKILTSCGAPVCKSQNDKTDCDTPFTV